MNWKNLWMRMQSWGFFLFASSVVAGAGLFLFLPVLRQRHAMQMKLQGLEQQIQTMNHTEAQYREELKALEKDPAYVERIARDKLNLVRPGETFFRFEPAPTAPAPPSPRR